MKKLLTLLFCTGLVSASFAQTDRERAADVILGGNRGATTTTYPSSGNSCQDQIDAVNRNYDAQVVAMRNNGAYSAADRETKIRQINNARRTKINEVRRSCGTNGTAADTRKHHGKRKVKSNNGNHYGWEKGKGNPHGNGQNVKAKGKHKNG
ncbi:MAG: hypothetical protein EOO08_15285 [Chitinophagaceae bacterium]|nr:MAG: hypothetical protein EOO08_15285 [Chitinophagaceae bacterium]